MLNRVTNLIDDYYVADILLEGGRLMGTYVNPGNQSFRRIAGANYVDKTGMIALMNERIGGDNSLVCISRPRRFGKSYAAQIEKMHMEETVPLHYNSEDSLRSVIKLAYYSYRDHYLQFEELPAGEGYADVVYLPKSDTDWPVLVIELKWNQNATGAIDQILQKKYPTVIESYGRPVLLVGISYDKDAPAGKKKHQCRIVRYSL